MSDTYASTLLGAIGEAIATTLATITLYVGFLYGVEWLASDPVQVYTIIGMFAPFWVFMELIDRGKAIVLGVSDE